MWIAKTLLLAAPLALAAGCAQYQRSPLNLDGYLQSWTGRTADCQPVRDYARKLTRTDDPDSATFDLDDGLTLSEAEAIALYFNPDLRLARARAEVPLAGAKEAGWWPDPSIEASLLRFTDRGSPTRFRLNGPSIDGVNLGGLESTPFGFRRVESESIEDPYIVGASLSLTIPISGRLAVEKDLAWSQYDAAWRDIAVREWQLVENLRTTWREWSAASERLRLTQEYLARLEVVADNTHQLAGVGELPPTDARLIRIELARQQTTLIAVQLQEERGRLKLLAMMGLPPDCPVQCAPDLNVPPVHVPGKDWRKVLLASHPRLKAAQADYETAEQSLRLEIREQYPDLDIGPSYSFEEGFSRLGMGVGFKLPLWNRNRRAVAEAIAAREAARVRAQTQLESAVSAYRRAQADLEAAHDRRRTLTQTVAPLVDQQVDDTRKLLDVGEVDILLLRDALSTSFQTKLDIVEAAAAEAVAADTLRTMLHPPWSGNENQPDKEPES